MRQCFFIALLCVSLAACGAPGTRQSLPAGGDGYQGEALPVATTVVYDCNGYDFIARLGPGEMAVWLPDQYVVLSQTRSDTGTVYQEGEISFWRDGDNAMLTVGDAQYLNCQLQPHRVPWEDARRRGVDFRAVGNEPGWHIEIRKAGDMLFVTGYGMERVVLPTRKAESAGNSYLYEGSSEAHALRVEILDQECADSMSGEAFPNTAVVTFDQVRYQGCGQFLEYPWEDGP